MVAVADSGSDDNSLPRRRRWSDDVQAAPRDTRLSVWTIVGSIAASVIATAIIGGAAGLLQVPTIARDVDLMKNNIEVNRQSMGGLSERVRSGELVSEAINRRITDLVESIREIDRKRDRLQDDFSKFREFYVNEHAALEGRSKDRHTEAMGAVNSLRVSDNALRDQIATMATGQQQVRAQLLELSMRISSQRQNFQQQQPLQPQPQSSPDEQREPSHNVRHELPGRDQGCDEADIGSCWQRITSSYDARWRWTCRPWVTSDQH